MDKTFGDIGLSRNKHNLLSVLIIVLIVLFSVLVIVNVVEIQNKVKTGRYIGQEIAAQNNISVQATGEVYVKPDLAVATFSVINEQKEVADALAENSEQMNKVIEAIKEEGVESKDLKTTGFRIYPRYEWYDGDRSYYPEGERVLVGYEVSQTLEVKIRDMAIIGDIIKIAADQGANQMGGINFTLDDEDAAKQEARRAAIEEAKTKARELADQLEVRLVRITDFTESLSAPYRNVGYAEDALDMASGSVPSIETGENKVSVTVQIKYEIN